MSYRNIHKYFNTAFPVICYLLVAVLLVDTLSPMYLDVYHIDAIELTDNGEKETKEEKNEDNKEETDECLHNQVYHAIGSQIKKENKAHLKSLWSKPWIKVFLPPPEKI